MIAIKDAKIDFIIKRKKLIYSILLLLFAVILIFTLTFSWFVTSSRNRSNMDLYYAGSIFQFQHTVDANRDGYPDTDEDDNVIYVNNNDVEEIRFENYYPMCESRFRVNVRSDETLKFYYCFLGAISYTGPGESVSAIDVTEAFKVRFTLPGETVQRDVYLSDLMDADGRATLFKGYPVAGHEDYTFDYTIYMAADAGNEYKNHTLIIGSAVFGINFE